MANLSCGGLVAGLVCRVVGLSFRRILSGMGLSVSLQTVLIKEESSYFSTEIVA